jgi:uncharacterized repeat protein (TIGR01451 family)
MSTKLKLLLQKILLTQLPSVIGAQSSRFISINQSSYLFRSRSFKLICALGFTSTTQLFWLPQTAQAQTIQSNLCAVPGKDGIDTGITQVVNSYYAGPNSDTIVNPGAKTVPVGAINSQGNQATITAGDLLLIIQMQDADINFTDTTAYGSGNTANNGSGSTAINRTGLYEYVVAQNSVGAAGGTLQIRGSGAGGGLINSYRQQAANITSHGQRTYQVIRVPQFTNATLSGTIRSPGSWNGKSGGIIALDVTNTLTMAGGTIEVQDKGFRGGGGTSNTDTYPAQEDESFRTDGNIPRGGVKGEGIAGTPLYVFDGTNTTNTGVDGYPRLPSADTYTTIVNNNTNGGSRGRGAPGNAGGGGNQHNSGGGGGGNSGAGGQGGKSIKTPGNDDNTPGTGISKLVGGRGGFVFPITITPTIDRLVMGGGGGAGDANNGVAGSGGLGGGIIMIRAGAITGSGTISAKARDGVVTPSDDGGSGAGAGGSILILAKGGSLANITLDARGGNGGDTNTATTVPYDFGPGGGGGGGAIFSSIPTGNTMVTGGAPGKSFNGQLGGTTGVTREAEPGAPGSVIAGSIGSTQIPGILSGADCNAKVLIVKRITEIQANRNTNPNDLSRVLNQAIDRPAFAADDPAPVNNWPSNFLVGAYDAGRINPGNTVEYTIYFLNSSGLNAKNVRICDQIVGSQTFVNDAYGLAGSGRDIEYRLGTNPVRYLTRSVNTAVDRAQLDSSTGTIANCPAPTINGINNGTVVIDITGTGSTGQDTLLSLPAVTGPGTANSYGYFRFKTKINP